jgi:hypothetical protein
MAYTDPIYEVEKIVKEVHDHAGKYTRPVLKRYPLLFAFFLTFSVAAIIHGFDLMTDGVPVFENHPWLLVLLGSTTLFLTGTLYKHLERDHK